MIIGCSGAGKSTLAMKVVKRSGLRLINMDKFYYRANWQEIPKDDVMKLVKNAIKRSGWVFDGNHSSSYKIRSDMAQMIVWLDIPRWQCVLNVIWRGMVYLGRNRPSMAEGCNERISWAFLKFVWYFNRDRRWKMENFITQLQNDKTIYHLKSYAEIRQFLSEIDGYEFKN